MNFFNRFFLVIYSLLFIAACAGLIVMAWNQDQKLDIVLGSFNLQAFILSDDRDRWLFSAMMGLLAMIGVISLIMAFSRGGKSASSGTVRLRATDGGVVEIDASAVEALLRSNLESLPQVRQASPHVKAAKGSVETDITVSVYPGASISDITHTVNETTANVLRQQVGATQVRRPVLHITYDELAAVPSGRMRPQSQPAPGTLPPPPGSVQSQEPLTYATPPPPPAPAVSEPLRYEAQPTAVLEEPVEAPEFVPHTVDQRDDGVIGEMRAPTEVVEDSPLNRDEGAIGGTRDPALEAQEAMDNESGYQAADETADEDAWDAMDDSESGDREARENREEQPRA
jgi:hypothetical protein